MLFLAIVATTPLATLWSAPAGFHQHYIQKPSMEKSSGRSLTLLLLVWWKNSLKIGFYRKSHYFLPHCTVKGRFGAMWEGHHARIKATSLKSVRQWGRCEHANSDEVWTVLTSIFRPGALFRFRFRLIPLGETETCHAYALLKLVIIIFWGFI